MFLIKSTSIGSYYEDYSIFLEVGFTPLTPSINSDEAKCYNETSHYIADMLTEVLVFFSSFSSWILNQLMISYSLGAFLAYFFFYKIMFC